MKSSILLAFATTSSVFALGVQIETRQTNWTVGQTVQTSSGPVSGHAAKNNSAVSEYLGIKYAQAPVGDLRFAAPVAFNGTAPLNGSSFGFSCPVAASTGSSYNISNIEFANVTSAGIATLANMGGSGPYSEDCLSLNVWTKPQTGESKKAVLVWIYGGGFSSGTTNTPAYSGTNIAAQEDVVLVSINYRLSILGFPGNPSGTNNVALLDQRLGIEWVRDNIANFGGDPSRITIFGQSAGGASVDLYSYAWASDPIATGFIPESGNVFGWGLPNTPAEAATGWYSTTQTLGCGNASSTDQAAVLSCMRAVNYTTLLAAQPKASGTAGILGYFGPTADEKVVFSNYTGRAQAAVPMLIGNADYEGGLFRTEFALTGLTYPDYFWTAFNLKEFTCPTGIRANASIAANNPTWRYRYMGVFPNTMISSEAGAWHASELPLLFNTNIPVPAATPEQISIGNYMRGAWAAFAKDPKTGLTNYGWPVYNTSQDTLVRLAYNNITGPNLINPRAYDADCVFVNVTSTDSGAARPVPDLGATVTPTGTAMPSGTGASSTASTTSSGPSTSATGTTGAGLRISVGGGASAWVGIVALVAAYLV